MIVVCRPLPVIHEMSERLDDFVPPNLIPRGLRSRVAVPVTPWFTSRMPRPHGLAPLLRHAGIPPMLLEG